MKKFKTLLTLGILAIAGYAAQASTVIVNSNILTNKTWFRTNTYILQGFIYVKSGATLTIQSGTIIKGDKATKGSLIVERGCQLIANGTLTQPIVFTSNQPVGSKAPGDWGGVILLGNGHVNQPGGTAIIEGGFTAPDGVYGGGASPNDAESSGSLKYVRIEYAGIAFQPNNEINGLTLGAVGAGTTLEHIQVSYSGDDSFEFFGGAVNAKWLVAFRAIDDDFDTDFGYTGKLQFCVALRDPNVADQVSLSNGFESDNDGTGSSLTPITSATMCNITILGGNPSNSAFFNAAARLRRNTQESLYNTILMGYPAGLHIDGTASEANATNNLLQFQNNIIAGCTNALKVNTGSTFDIASYVTSQGGNTILTNNSDAQLTDPYNLSAPNFVPQGGSPALSGASFSNSRLQDPFFTSVSYRGAFGTSDWTKCWTEWDPQNQSYSVNPIDNSPAASITTSDPLTHCTGVNVTFNANTGGGLTYQWYKGSNAQNGATSSNYTNATAGTFKVLVTNTHACTKYSNTLTAVISAPSVTVSNNNLSLCVNNPVALSASSGTATGYQWTQNGSDIGGATSSSYNATTAASYAVRVIDGAGCTAVSSNKVVNSTTPKPTVSINGNSGICPPQTTQLVRNNVSGLTYQWQVYNGSAYTNIGGATGTTYTVSTPGKYRVRGISGTGCSTSNSAAVTITNTCRFAADEATAQNSALSVYPNPFTNETTMAFDLEKESNVVINIYDVTGKLVIEAANGTFNEGENEFKISANELQTGFYVAKVSVNGAETGTVKLIVQKN